MLEVNLICPFLLLTLKFFLFMAYKPAFLLMFYNIKFRS